MRACLRCSYDNPDHLIYCFSCGRRLSGGAGVSWAGAPAAAREAAPSPALKTAPGSGLASETAPDGFAATIAHARTRDGTPSGQQPVVGSNILMRGLDCLRYVFLYVRGRIDAEGRRRALVEERDGAHRLVHGAYAELGQIILAQPDASPELAGPVEAVRRVEAQRATAIADLAAAEKFQAADDLRLGLEQASAETELNACERGAAELDRTLRQMEEERREIDTELGRHRDPNHGSTARGNSDATALESKRANLEVRYGSQRERAAALRASTIAARAKVDQASAARRQAAAAMAASLVGHARARGDAEASIRELVAEIGRVATQIRFPLSSLLPGYARVSRLEQTIVEREREIESVERMMGQYSLTKLATGVGLLSAILCVLGASLWALLR
jgi:hypothetical protein